MCKAIPLLTVCAFIICYGATFTFIYQSKQFICSLYADVFGARCAAVGWDTVLQTGNSGFDSRRCHWNSSLTKSFRPHYGPELDSASNRNEYQEYFLGGKGGRCVRLTILQPPCAGCLEICEPHPPGTLTACPGIAFFNWTVLLSVGTLRTADTLTPQPLP